MDSAEWSCVIVMTYLILATWLRTVESLFIFILAMAGFMWTYETTMKKLRVKKVRADE